MSENSISEEEKYFTKPDSAANCAIGWILRIMDKDTKTNKQRDNEITDSKSLKT